MPEPITISLGGGLTVPVELSMGDGEVKKGNVTIFQVAWEGEFMDEAVEFAQKFERMVRKEVQKNLLTFGASQG